MPPSSTDRPHDPEQPDQSTCAVCQLANPLFALAGFLVLAGVMVAIRFRRPGFFERWIRLPLRSQWRRWSVYRYKWPATMDFAELNRYRSNGTRIPCATAR